jgi:hypothetical protein
VIDERPPLASLVGAEAPAFSLSAD